MDGLLMKKLTTYSLRVAAFALACTGVGTATAADISLPPDPGARDAPTLVSFACSKCHGYSTNGISVTPLIPILAGQNPVYIHDNWCSCASMPAAIPMRGPSCGASPIN